MAEWWLPTGVSVHDVHGAYEPVRVANYAESLLDIGPYGNNLIDPGGIATPDWGGTIGWYFDGIAQYLITNFVPKQNQEQSMFIEFSNAVVDIGAVVCLAGMFDAAGIFGIFPDEGAIGVRYANGLVQDVGPTKNAGNLGISGVYGYRDGIQDNALAIANWFGIPTEPIHIGCFNFSGIMPLFFVNAIIRSLVIFNRILTQEHIDELVDNMNSLGQSTENAYQVWIPNEQNIPTGRTPSGHYGPWS